jgi:hypothetical protein
VLVEVPSVLAGGGSDREHGFRGSGCHGRRQRARRRGVFHLGREHSSFIGAAASHCAHGLPRRARGPRPRPVRSAWGERERTGGYFGVRPSTNTGAPRGGPNSESGLGASNSLGRRSALVGAVPRAARDVAARRGATSVGLVSCHCSPIRALKTPEIRIEVHQVVNRKVVHLTTLYNFYKGSRLFFSTDFA